MAESTTSRRSRRPVRNIGRERLLAAVSVIVLFVAGGAALAMTAPQRLALTPTAPSVWAAVAATGTAPVPTPVFASVSGLELRIPVPSRAVTALAFHQSSYAGTIPFSSRVAFGSAADARAAATAAREARKAGQEASILATPEGADRDDTGTWTGTALQLWRSGVAGKQDTAVDCGAAAGSPVLSPVDGTVMQVRPYKLYDRVDDFEIHIRPDTRTDLDVILLHVTGPAVTPGQRVVAGVTQIAKVRKLSSVISGLQLRTYTLDGGNHTHLQINRIPRPNDEWVLGQDPPGFVRRK